MKAQLTRGREHHKKTERTFSLQAKQDLGIIRPGVP